MTMTCGIYMLTNECNRKSYIGASKNIEKRFSDHKNHKGRIGKIIKKEGLDNFSFHILEECSKTELRVKERDYIRLYDTKIPYGYNLTDGGEYNENTTGYYRVCEMKGDNLTAGSFYRYMCTIDGKSVSVGSESIDELRKKVKQKGWVWKITDEDLAKETLQKNRNLLKDSGYVPKQNMTGFFRVHFNKYNGYVYSFQKNGEHIRLVSVNIDVLKDKVERKNLPWRIIDEKKALATIRESAEYNKNYKYKIYPTGFLKVSKCKCNSCLQGFQYCYKYYFNGMLKQIRSVDLNLLETKVKEKGLPWKIVDKEKADFTISENKKNLDKFKYPPKNKSGFFRVSKNGNSYKYHFRENGKNKSLSNPDIFVLKKMVEDNGLIWIITDKEKAEKTIEQSQIYISKKRDEYYDEI